MLCVQTGILITNYENSQTIGLFLGKGFLTLQTSSLVTDAPLIAAFGDIMLLDGFTLTFSKGICRVYATTCATYYFDTKVYIPADNYLEHKILRSYRLFFTFVLIPCPISIPP